MFFSFPRFFGIYREKEERIEQKDNRSRRTGHFFRKSRTVLAKMPFFETATFPEGPKTPKTRLSKTEGETFSKWQKACQIMPDSERLPQT